MRAAMLSVLVWWLVLQVVGLVALPVTLWLLRFLPDRGFGYARPVGLLLSGYLFWLLVSLGVLQNTTISVVAALLLVATLSLLAWRRHGAELRAALFERRRIIVVTEALFAAALVLFCLFRAFSPDIAGTEKPMEFAFLNGILRSPAFPPNDPWLSGYAISYYYFGYVIAAMLTRLSGLASDVTFSLLGATLFAMTVSGAFTLAYNMVQATLHARDGGAPGPASRGALLTGGLAAVLVALMGNLAGVFELIRARGGGSEALWRWLDIRNLGATLPSRTWYPDDMWWWWRASRVIHDRNELGHSMEVIHEFPFFSFLLGDNHPHVLALPFAFLMLALALNLLLSRPGARAARDERPGAWAAISRYAHDLWEGGPVELLGWALIVGSLGFMNTWDYPIYLGILALAYLVRRQYDRAPGWEWLADGVSFGMVLLVLGIGLYFPFYLSFRSQAGGVGWVGEIKTRLHQYLIVQGVFVFMSGGLLAVALGRYLRSDCRPDGRPDRRPRLPRMAAVAGGVAGLAVVLCIAQGWWAAALALALAGAAAVLVIVGSRRGMVGEDAAPLLHDSTTLALLLVVAGFLLTASVEFIFLRDVFSSRMNTVFKFYYQAWALLGVASAYGAYSVARALPSLRGAGRVAALAWCGVSVVLVAAGLSYTVAAIPSRANGFRGTPTLNGTRYVDMVRPHDAAAVRWLRENAPPGAVMLEASGGSYSEHNWVSAHTGIPTLLGWPGHQRQWRGSYDLPNLREPDIAAVYQGADAWQTWTLLEQYGVDYVYLGPLEKSRYQPSPVALNKLDRLLTRVYENNGVIIYGHSRRVGRAE